MKFTTTGEVRTNTYNGGTVTCYYVGRKDMPPICLHTYIDEYSESGHIIYIDGHGAAWVKR